MQGYESVFITDPDLSEEALSGILDKVKNTVTHQGGAIQQYHHWGRRRLAYPINKKNPRCLSSALHHGRRRDAEGIESAIPLH